MTDALGNLVRFVLMPGHRFDTFGVAPLIKGIRFDAVLADKAFDSNWIIADMNDRVREEMKREKISEETARYILSKDDEERRKWGIQVYGADTWDSRLYDMVLKIKTLCAEDAADLIVETARKPSFQMTPDDLKRLRDMALAARVQATLGNLIPSIQVYAEDGAVTLCNIHVNVSLETNVLEEAKQMAASMDGVKSVVLNMMPKSEDCQHINPFYNINCK